MSLVLASYLNLSLTNLNLVQRDIDMKLNVFCNDYLLSNFSNDISQRLSRRTNCRK